MLAGLPAGMLRAVLVVYDGLASRSGAFNGVRMYGSSGRELPIGGPDAQSVLGGCPSHYGGLVDGIRFTADYTVQHAWKILIYAC